MKIWSHPPGLNRRPTDYESVALPAELGWPSGQELKRGARLSAHSSAIITHGDPCPPRRTDGPRNTCRVPRIPPLPPPSIPPYLPAYRPPPSRSPGSISIDSARHLSHAKLPPAAIAFLEPFRQAHHILIASTGVELLTIARGVVPGATQIAPDLALNGAANLIAAATAAHPPASILARRRIGRRQSPLSGLPLRGGVALPLEGNWSNVNNLLRDTEYVTLAVLPGDPTELELTAQCPTRGDALYDSNRAFAPSSPWRQPPAPASLPPPVCSNPSAYAATIAWCTWHSPRRSTPSTTFCPEALIQFLLEPHRTQTQHRDAVHRQAVICGHNTSTPAPFRKMPRTISMK